MVGWQYLSANNAQLASDYRCIYAARTIVRSWYLKTVSRFSRIYCSTDRVLFLFSVCKPLPARHARLNTACYGSPYKSLVELFADLSYPNP
jgi:hypothetical protein